MTAVGRATLKGVFENGDVPTESDYTNLVDSFVNLVDTTAQSLSSPLSVTVLTTPEVSAGDVNATGRVSASAVNVLGVVSASVISAVGVVVTGVVSASSMVVAADLSAQSIGASALTVTVSASLGALACTTLQVNTSITAAASVGGGEAAPASVAGYLHANVNGTDYLIPLYAVG